MISARSKAWRRAGLAALAAAGAIAGTAVAEAFHRPFVYVEATRAACGGERAVVGRIVSAGPGLAVTVEDGSIFVLEGLWLPGGEAAAMERVHRRIDALRGASLVMTASGGPDRHGARPGQARAGGVWIQDMLVRQGLALVAPFDDPCAFDLLAAEEEARQNSNGLWADASFLRRSDDAALAESVPDMMLVEGDVVSVGESRGRIFLNFGRNWDRDFTVLIPGELVERLRREGLEPTELAERPVRVRGWAVRRGGAFIELEHVAALQILATGRGEGNPDGLD